MQSLCNKVAGLRAPPLLVAVSEKWLLEEVRNFPCLCDRGKAKKKKEENREKTHDLV